MRSVYLSFLALVLVLSSTALPARAAGLTEDQISAIVNLVKSFGADSTVILNVEASLRGVEPSMVPAAAVVATSPAARAALACLDLPRTLYLGATDAQTNGEVSKLQKFLAADKSIYPEGIVNGRFGPATEQAVKRWQKAHGLVSSGSANTTGYGLVGAKTRAAMACNTPAASNSTPTPQAAIILPRNPIDIISPATTATTSVGAPLTITYSVNASVSGGEEVSVQASIVYGSSDVVYVDYVTQKHQPGKYSFDWLPHEPGTYQAKVVMTAGGTTYTARSGMLNVVTGPLAISSAEAPVVEFNSSETMVGTAPGAMLTWNVKHAQRCILKYGTVQEVMSPQGSKAVTPSETTTYTLVCSNDPGTSGDTKTAEKAVTVTVAKPACTLVANKSVYSYGDMLSLTWKSENANYAKFNISSANDKLALPWEKLPTNGSYTTTILSTPTEMPIKLIAQSYYGQAECNATIKVQ